MDFDTKGINKVNLSSVSDNVNSKYRNVDSWNDSVYESFSGVVSSIKRSTDDINTIVAAIRTNMESLAEIDSKKSAEILDSIENMIASLN